MKTAFRIVTAALLVAAVSGCNAPASGNAASASFELKAYSVPATQSKAIARNLDAVLASPEFLVGTKAHSEMRATQPFPGAVLVLAPASVQPSIARAIEDMAKAAGKSGHEAVDVVPLRVQFWVVQAKAGSGEDAIALKPLAPTLAQLRQALGPSHFVLDDSATLAVDAAHDNMTVGNGSVTTSRGRIFAFHAATLGTGGVSLDLKFANADTAAAQGGIPTLNTTVVMQPGEYIVLAEAPPSIASTSVKDATLMNLLVARVERLTPAAR